MALRVANKIACLAGAAAFGLLSSACLADTYVGQITLDTGAYQNGVGGEFSAGLNPIAFGANPAPTPIPLQIVAQASAVSAPHTLLPGDPANAVYFQTFCIEAGNHDVDFDPGNWGGPNYSAYLVTPPPSGEPGNPDWLKLSAVTATLFDAFSYGTLAAADLPHTHYLGYDYDNTNNGRSASAGILQDAIWVAQGDFGDISNYADVLAAATAAQYEAGISGSQIQQAVDLYYLALHNKLTTDGNTIDVLNLIDSNGNPAQAQLVEVPAGTPQNLIGSPVPLPKSAGVGFMMLAGFGVTALVRRRLKVLNRINAD